MRRVGKGLQVGAGSLRCELRRALSEATGGWVDPNAHQQAGG